MSVAKLILGKDEAPGSTARKLQAHLQGAKIFPQPACLLNSDTSDIGALRVAHKNSIPGLGTRHRNQGCRELATLDSYINGDQLKERSRHAWHNFYRKNPI